MTGLAKQYIHYQPHFDIRRALRFRVQDEGIALEAEPEIPSEILSASSILAADLLAYCDVLLDKARALMSGLADCIERSFPGAVSAYEKALESDDRYAAALFEDEHCTDLAGSVQAELYAVCRNIVRSLKAMRPYITDCISPVKPSEGARLVDLEERYYTDLAYQEYRQPGSVDRLGMAYEAQLKHQAKARLDYFDEAIVEVENIATAGYEDFCSGDVSTVALEIASMRPEEAKALSAILKVAHSDLAVEGVNINNHNRTFATEEMTEALCASLVSLLELRLKDSANILKWLQSADLENEDSALYYLAHHLLAGVEVLDRSLDTTILDLAKSQETERMLVKKKLDNIAQRKQVRRLLTLIEKIREISSANIPVQEIKQRAKAVAYDLGRRAGLCM